jgi:type I restriction-modification system DNA methylase subunit
METVIDKIRGIMRKEGVTGMDSINHCIVFVIARMLDENKCKKFGIDIKNSYYNIMHDEDGDLIDAQELYGRIYTKNDTTCLVGQIANKLKFSNIKFKLESPQHVEQIMKELEKLDMTKLEIKYDIIGTIYEYHLKSGTSNAMRDLGQYYTNRLVIEFMIKLCDIKMNKKGEIDTIIDPTMGTGGFLTMAVKYLNDKYKNKIDWTKNKNRVYGFDIDENVKNMALLNMLLECGEMCEDTFIKNDTLYNDFKLKNGDILEKVDVILANEPMGIKNIIHASCCERIKELKIRGTKAEPLFLQLFMEALNDGGRCAVIVPDGVLFNDSNLHNDTRKYLVENCNLKKVIGLNDDFFLNTGVKTSILFFVKDGKTTEVEFSELKLNKNEVIENSIIKVDYKKIVDTGYSLFVNKYNAKDIVKIEGVKYEKLGDVCEFLQKSKRQASYGKEEGLYPFYTSGVNIKRCDECDYNEECIIVGTGGNANIKYDKQFSCSADNFIIKFNKNISIKYIYYYFLTNMNILENGFVGSTIKHISKDYVQNIEIPIPSLEVQQKIVEQLDVIYKNIQTCKEQIVESKKIMKYYVETMTYWEESKKLGDLCDINKENINSKYKYINYVDIGSIDEGKINNITKMTSDYPSRAKRVFKKDDILLSTIRPNLRNYVYIDNEIENGICSTGFCVISKKLNINNKYVYYQLMSDNITHYLINNATGSQYPAVNSDIIMNIQIPLPSLEKQKEIVEHCDELNATIKSMESRIKSNEMLMKNIMETYLKTNDKNKDEKKSDRQQSESDDNKEIDQKPVKKIKTKNVKKVESSSESDSSSDSSESKSSSEDLKSKKKLVKKTK